MTKKQVRQKTRQLIQHAADRMRDNLEKALNSGAIDIKSYNDDYLLPKCILCVLLKEESVESEPPKHLNTKEWKKEFWNIYRNI